MKNMKEHMQKMEKSEKIGNWKRMNNARFFRDTIGKH